MSMVSHYRKLLEKERMELHTRKGQLHQLEQERDAIAQKISRMKQTLLAMQEAQLLLQKTSEEAREYGKKRLEEVVTSALQFVFGPDVHFEIELTEVGGKPQAEFYLVTTRGAEEVRTRPTESNGGGVVDIISLALRIAVLQIHHDPHINGPIILDEPGKHVSEEYAEKMATFLQQMSNYFGRQIIMVTHQPYLAEVADKSFEVQMVGGKSQVNEFVRTVENKNGASTGDALGHYHYENS